MTFQLNIDDCWNRIGVASKDKCNELEEYLHCRNCPKYHEAARTLMHRPVQEEYQQEWARHFAQVEDARHEARDSALVFRIGHEWLALATGTLVTVAEKAAAHRLPHCHVAGLLGIVNVSGKLYPCISLAELMRIDLAQPYVQSGRHSFPRLIVVRLGMHVIALPVDDVHGIEHYSNKELLPPPSTISHGVSSYLSGVLDFQGKQTGYIDASLLGECIAKVIR